MGTTKAINMLLNFKADTPKCIIEGIIGSLTHEGSFLKSGYRHPCGKPVIDFYLDEDRPQDYHKSDGTWYLRYCNSIKDYDNNFEEWMNTIAPYIIQVNGHHVGTSYNSDDEVMHLICIEGNKLVYKQLLGGK